MFWSTSIGNADQDMPTVQNTILVAVKRRRVLFEDMSMETLLDARAKAR
jgi:hypothetical protein